MYNSTLTQQNIKDYLKKFEENPQLVNTASQFAEFLIHRMQAIDKAIQDRNDYEESIKEWGRNMAKQLKEQLNVKHENTSYFDWSYTDFKFNYSIYYVPNKEKDFTVSVTDRFGNGDKTVYQFKTIEEIVEFRNKFELAQ